MNILMILNGMALLYHQMNLMKELLQDPALFVVKGLVYVLMNLILLVLFAEMILVYVTILQEEW